MGFRDLPCPSSIIMGGLGKASHARTYVRNHPKKVKWAWVSFTFSFPALIARGSVRLGCGGGHSESLPKQSAALTLALARLHGRAKPPSPDPHQAGPLPNGGRKSGSDRTAERWHERGGWAHSINSESRHIQQFNVKTV